MKTHIYLTLKYWKKHKKNAAALLFAGVLLTAVVFVAIMSNRERFVRKCHSDFDATGHFDLMIFNSDDELISEILNGEKGYRDDYNYGAIYVYGKMGTPEIQFTYGTLDDEHNIHHIPLDEGRLPETDTELIATVKVLDKFFWVGKCGDTITLDGKTYTVVGIINEVYDDGREGTDEELYKWYLEDSWVYSTPYRIPSIFVGQCDKEPLYRIDLFNKFWAYPFNNDWDTPYSDYRHYLQDIIGFEYCDFSNEEISYPPSYLEHDFSFFMIIALIGSVIAVLSVCSVLRNIFTDRRPRIETLKNIGMSKRSIGCMYAVECAVFTLLQTVIGIAVGLGAYGAILLFKTSFLGEKPYSGFTDIKHVIKMTDDPFLFAAIVSAAVMIAAYILNALTVNVKRKIPNKKRKPASLSRCFGRVFRQRGVTAVQTASLMLICFSVLFGYILLTDNGKEYTIGVNYSPPSSDFYAGGFNMGENGIAEYYESYSPMISSMGHPDNDKSQNFPFIDISRTEGIDDTIADKLPEYTLVTGYLPQTFIASDEPIGLGKEIDLSNEEVRENFLYVSNEKYQNFFDEGQIGSKHMFRIETKITHSSNIATLSEYVVDGEINIEAINRGEEILVVFQGRKPRIKVGETVTICSVGGELQCTGIGDLSSAEVKIGALIQIYPGEFDEIKYHTIRSGQDNISEQEYNFLTTASGGGALGLHCARYNEIFAFEPMDGGIIPYSAHMSVKAIAAMERDHAIQKALQYGSSLLILLVMSLLGFAAYFNGIGMKIRLRAYDISVMRAVGAPVSEVRRRLLLNSLKIPLIASALAYGIIKAMQLVMEKVYVRMLELTEQALASGESLDGPLWSKIFALRRSFYLNDVMWQVNAEIPALILFAVICAVTFILTAIALKKFRGNIAGDLNEGRKRR